MFWEELNVNKFAESLEITGGVCVIPLGCMEKHGNHLPLGTDVYIAREIAARAATQEEFMIFPYYPLGIVAEVKHKAGTVAVSSQLQFQMLEAICEEVSHNGYSHRQPRKLAYTALPWVNTIKTFHPRQSCFYTILLFSASASPASRG